MKLVFDIGGTRMRVAGSKDGTSIDIQKEAPTPHGFEEGVVQCVELTRSCAGGEKIESIAGGVPGILSRDKAQLVDAPNLKGWEHKPLQKALENAFGVSVRLENDAALAALGEAVYGAGKGKRIVAYFTVSTGFGGARVTDGRIDASALGFEPWRQIVSDDNHRLGHYLSGNGLKKKYGKNPEEIDDPAVWEEVERWLAVGLNNAIALWSPDIIVLGGGVMAQRLSLDRVQSILKGFGNFPEFPEITAAQLGDASGLWGALASLKEK